MLCCSVQVSITKWPHMFPLPCHIPFWARGPATLSSAVPFANSRMCSNSLSWRLRGRQSQNRSVVDECEYYQACICGLKARVIEERLDRGGWSSHISEAATAPSPGTTTHHPRLSAPRRPSSSRSGYPSRPGVDIIIFNQCDPRAGYASRRPPRRS